MKAALLNRAGVPWPCTRLRAPGGGGGGGGGPLPSCRRPSPSNQRAPSLTRLGALNEEGIGEGGAWTGNPIAAEELWGALEAAAGNPFHENENTSGTIDLATLPPREEIDKFLEVEAIDLQERHELAGVTISQLLGTTGPAMLAPLGGTCIWLDLRPFLEWPDFGDETALFRDLVESYGVVLMPGGACGAEEPGWFRCHVAAVDEWVLGEGLDRVERLLKYKQLLHGNW